MLHRGTEKAHWDTTKRTLDCWAFPEGSEQEERRRGRAGPMRQPGKDGASRGTQVERGHSDLVHLPRSLGCIPAAAGKQIRGDVKQEKDTRSMFSTWLSSNMGERTAWGAPGARRPGEAVAGVQVGQKGRNLRHI